MNLQQVTEELATELARPVLVIGLDESRLASSSPSASDGSNHVVVPIRSEERRVGKECSAVCRSRWSPYH